MNITAHETPVLIIMTYCFWKPTAILFAAKPVDVINAMKTTIRMTKFIILMES